MLAHNNEYLEEASATIYQLSQEERIRMECEAREDFYRTQHGLQYRLNRQEAEIKTQSAEIKELNSTIDKLHTWMKAHGYDPNNL